MKDILQIIAAYARPIGIEAFSSSLLAAARALNGLCWAVGHRPLPVIIETAGITAPGALDGWSLPDALWLVACVRAPGLGHYPLGEITEHAFKRCVTRLAFFDDQSSISGPDASIAAIQQNVRSSIHVQGMQRVLCFFLADFFYAVCMDSERRSKTGTRDDPCFRFHFPADGQVRSLADEKECKRRLLESCRQMAEEFLPALQKSLKARNSAPLSEKLSDVFRRVFHRSPRSSKLKRTRKLPLNVIVGAMPAAKLKPKFDVALDVIRLHLHTTDANVSCEYSQIQAALARMTGNQGHELHSLSKDLLDIGAVVYVADQMVKREATLRRRLDILMPVHHADLWNKVSESLAEVISCLGRDEVHFHFIKAKGADKAFRFQPAPGKRCVSLFSGGLDSAAGAISILNEQWDPIFLSHHSSPVASGLQHTLLSKFTGKKDESLPWVSTFVGPSTHKKRNVLDRLKDPPRTPMTQFLRSFLFLSLAVVVAVESGIERILIFENGPIALNPVFSEGKVNTHTAHPRFLASFQTLVNTLFKADLQIENPFLYKTKGEVACYFAQPGFQKLLRKTNSCWNWLRVPLWAKEEHLDSHQFHQDGSCLPCIIRRAAVIHAELEGSDASYLRDVFSQFPALHVSDQVLIADYLRFCRNLETLQEAELLLEHPDLSVCAADVDSKALVLMYKRHASEMVAGFRRRASAEVAGLLLPEAA